MEGWKGFPEGMAGRGKAGRAGAAEEEVEGAERRRRLEWGALSSVVGPAERASGDGANGAAPENEGWDLLGRGGRLLLGGKAGRASAAG